MRPLQQAIDEDLSSSRVLDGMFASFAIIALVMAASGLYAVVSYSAGQRVQEFGVRIALGAVPRDIQWMMFRQMGCSSASASDSAWSAGALVANLASTLLYRVSPIGSGDLRRRWRSILGSIALVSSVRPCPPRLSYRSGACAPARLALS